VAPLKNFEICLKKLNEYCRAQRRNNRKVQEAVRKYRRLLGDSRRKSDDLERKLKITQRDKDKAVKEISVLNKKMDSLESENNFVNGKNTIMEKYVKEVVKELDAAKEEVKRLTVEKEESLKKLSSIEESEVSNKKFELLYSRLKETNEKLLNEKENMQKELEILSKQIKDLNDKLVVNGHTQTTIQELKEETLVLHKKINELEKQREGMIESHQQEIKKLEDSRDTTEISKARNEIISLKNKVKQLNNEKELLISDHKGEVNKVTSELERKLESVRSLNADLEEENRSLNVKYKSIREDKEKEIERLKKIIKESVKKEDSDAQIKELETSVKKLREEIAVLENERRDAEKKHENELGNLLNSNDIHIKEVKAGFETTIAELKDEAAELGGKVTGLEKENEKLKEKSKQASSEINNLETNLRRANDEIMKLGEEIRTLQDKITTLEQEKKAIIEEETANMNEVMAKVIKDTATLNNTIQNLQIKIAELEQERNKLHTELSKQEPFEDNSDYIRSLELKLYEYQNKKKDDIYSAMPAELSPKHTSDIVMLKNSIKDIEVKFYEYDTLTRNFSKGDQGLTQELEQMSKKTHELIRVAEERIKIFEHELASFEKEKERYNKEVNNLDNVKRHNNQEINNLQEQIRIMDLKLYSIDVDKEDYKKKYEGKMVELKRVKEMAERLKSDFERYKQKKHELGAKLALKIQEDSIRTSQKIEALTRELEEKTAELEAANKLLVERNNKESASVGDYITDNEDKIKEGRVGEENWEQALAKDEQPFNQSMGKTNNSQVGLKDTKGEDQ